MFKASVPRVSPKTATPVLRSNKKFAAFNQKRFYAAEVEQKLGANGVRQELLDTFEPHVFKFVTKADNKLVDKLNAIPPNYAFKLNSATEAQLNQIQADSLYETISYLDDPWMKEWKENGRDNQKWLNALKKCYGSVENSVYCWNTMKEMHCYPRRDHYKVFIDIHVRAGFMAGAAYSAGELSWNNKYDKPDDEVHNILLRGAIDLKDWRLANDQYKMMQSVGYKPDPALVQRLQELERTWDHAGYKKFVFEDGPKPKCVEDAENETYNRMKAQTVSLPYSPEPFSKRIERLRKFNWFNDVFPAEK